MQSKTEAVIPRVSLPHICPGLNFLHDGINVLLFHNDIPPQPHNTDFHILCSTAHNLEQCLDTIRTVFSSVNPSSQFFSKTFCKLLAFHPPMTCAFHSL